MRTFLRIATAAVVALALYAAAAVGLSEMGEVVVLHSRDAQGGVHRTRLWVVDDRGFAWLRGAPDRGWYRRVVDRPTVEVERGGATQSFLAVPVDAPDTAARIDRLMADKYGAADWMVRSLGRTAGAVPVRLEPRE